MSAAKILSVLYVQLISITILQFVKVLVPMLSSATTPVEPVMPATAPVQLAQAIIYTQVVFPVAVRWAS